MTLRDELAKAIEEAELTQKHLYDALLPWLEQKLREAEAVAIERCAQSAESDDEAHRSVAVANRLRTLSPDPSFLDRERVEARLDELHSVTHHRDWNEKHDYVCVTCERIAELQRQVDALKGKEVRDAR